MRAVRSFEGLGSRRQRCERAAPSLCEEHSYVFQQLNGRAPHVVSTGPQFEGEAPGLAHLDDGHDAPTLKELDGAGGWNRASVALRTNCPSQRADGPDEQARTLGRCVAPPLEGVSHPGTRNIPWPSRGSRRLSQARCGGGTRPTRSPSFSSSPRPTRPERIDHLD